MTRIILTGLALLAVSGTALAQSQPVTPTPDDFSRDRDCLSTRTYRADDIDAIPGADGAEWELYRAGTRIDGGPRSLNRGRFILRLNLHDYGPVLDGTAYGVRIRATGGGGPVAEWSGTTRFDGTAAVGSFDAGTNGVMAFSWDLGPVLSECATGGVLEIERDGTIVDTHEVGATAGSGSRPIEEYAPGTYLARFRAHSGSADPEDVLGLPGDPVAFRVSTGEFATGEDAIQLDPEEAESEFAEGETAVQQPEEAEFAEGETAVQQEVTPTPADFSRDQDCLGTRTYRADDIDTIPSADGAEWELYRAGTRIDGGPRSLNRGRFILRLNLHDYGPVLDGTAYGVRIRATGGGEPVAEWSETTRFDGTAAVESFEVAEGNPELFGPGVHVFSWSVGPILTECASGGVLEIERDGTIVDTVEVGTTAGGGSYPTEGYGPGTYLATFRAHSGSADPEDVLGLPSDPVEFRVPESLVETTPDPPVETTPDPPESEPASVAVRIQALDQAAAACVARPPSVAGVDLEVFRGDDVVATGTTEAGGATLSLLPGTYRVVARAAHCEETASELRVPGGAPIGVPIEGCVSKAADLEVSIRDVTSIPPGGPLPLTAVVRNVGQGVSGPAGLRFEKILGRRTVSLGTRRVEPICGGRDRTITVEDADVKRGETYTYRTRIFTKDADSGNNTARRDITMPQAIQETARILQPADQRFVFDQKGAMEVVAHAQANGWAFQSQRTSGSGDCHARADARTMPIYDTGIFRTDAASHGGTVQRGDSYVAHGLSQRLGTGWDHEDVGCAFQFFMGSPLAKGWRLEEVVLSPPTVKNGTVTEFAARVMVPPSGSSPYFSIQVSHDGQSVLPGRQASFTATRILKLVLIGPPGAGDWREAFRR